MTEHDALVQLGRQAAMRNLPRQCVYHAEHKRAAWLEGYDGWKERLAPRRKAVPPPMQSALVQIRGFLHED